MIIPKAKTIIDPIIIGLIKYSKDTLPIITIIGFPPAGGWVTLNKIIKQTPKPVANGIVIKMGKGINFKTTIPIKAVRRWPKKIFFGCAKGLSGYPYSKTIDDPNDAIKNKPKGVL